ncbi:MAG: hypothetical protein H2212_20105 [Ruminococcus sp.]|nr:hypothetical protein [Ruminococcus sp.]
MIEVNIGIVNLEPGFTIRTLIVYRKYDKMRLVNSNQKSFNLFGNIPVTNIEGEGTGEDVKMVVGSINKMQFWEGNV